MRTNKNWLMRTALIVMMLMAVITTVFATGETTEYISPFFNTPWAVLPPIIAIGLALLTKEVYSSLFVGILVGGLLYSNFAFETTVLHVFNDGIVASLTSSGNVGILIFLVLLGAMVCLMNRAGGSAAFGRWASKNIKSAVGVQLASVVLGCLIFIDDYFNCLTVGSVMRPVTDKHNISRAKLAYIIDSTAAPICIIAPISSWAAAVAGFADEGQGLILFIRSIPYNFYALFTILMMVTLIITRVDFGPMAKYEKVARETGDVFNGSNPYAGTEDESENTKGGIIDLALPIVALIICSVVGMIYTGDFFDGVSFTQSFANANAPLGLMLGAAFAFLITVVFYMIRGVMSFRDMMGCLPDGFKAMVPAIMILTLAWTLKAMTDSLGLGAFVNTLVSDSAGAFDVFLPAIIFVIACLLAFATGTSWGTFAILIPITIDIFPLTNPLGIVCISACLAGATCGDHCSPISDTTIMASAGAQCDHVNHVNTQLPYAITVAVISFVTYIIAGFVQSPIILLPIGGAMIIGFVLFMKSRQAKRV